MRPHNHHTTHRTNINHNFTEKIPTHTIHRKTQHIIFKEYSRQAGQPKRIIRAMTEHKPDAIECVQCGDTVPHYYRGPIGHAPSNLCWHCWVCHWAEMEIQQRKGGQPTQLETALYLIANGYTQRETSIIIGRARRTIARWIANLRRNPQQIPDWLVNPDTIRTKIKPRKNKDKTKQAA